MNGSTALAFLGCFLWGMISILFSPCHMASIPLMVAYIGGQKQLLKPSQAIYYSSIFAVGLFITITLIGFICTLLGRMLGEIGNFWRVLVGFVLMLVALDMFGIKYCLRSRTMLHRFHLKGIVGAFVLGLSYGVLSGSCTFGFIAPILAIITIQQKLLLGVVFILLFALGHCIPVVVAGCFGSLIRKMLEHKLWQGTANWFRKGSGVIIGLFSIYLMISPFI